MQKDLLKELLLRKMVYSTFYVDDATFKRVDSGRQGVTTYEELLWTAPAAAIPIMRMVRCHC